MRLSVFFAHTLPYPLLRDDPFLVGCLLLLLAKDDDESVVTRVVFSE